MKDHKERKISQNYGKIDLKELKEEYYSKGYIATTHIDSVGDKIMKETLDKWANEINSTQEFKADNVSIHHDRNDMNLAGRSVKGSAKVERLNDGEYGLWVETHHNKTHPNFADTVYQIDNGFLTHYSIEYDTHDNSATQRMNTTDGWVRVITPETDLVGYGLASPRTVVNENAAMTDEGYKELFHKKIDTTMVNKPVLESKETVPEALPEVKKMEEIKEVAVKEAPKIDEKELAEFDEFKQYKEMKKMLKDKKEEIKEAVEKKVEDKKPMIANKEKIEVETKEVKFKELADYKEAILQKKHSSVLFKEAAKLHNAFMKKGVQIKSGSMDRSETPFEVKEGKIELKAGLTTDSNYVGAQTTYWDALDHYEQTPAELNDIYGPAIISQLNEQHTTYNLLAKDDFSGDSAIRFRAKTARTSNVGSVAYGATPSWTSYTTRRKLNVAFVTYKADVAVEFEEIELANSPGGVGNIYAQEIADATEALGFTINSDILTSATTPSESEPYTFEQTIKTSGTLYGRTVTDSGYTTLAAAGVDNMSSAPLSLEKMRAMIDGVKANGAMSSDLAFICHYTQSRKFKTLIQSIQRTVPTSARVGFEGMAELDGVPIYEDAQANTDDLFLVDLKHMRFGIKKAPTYVEFGLTTLERKGIIWMMGNLYCTAPNHNYWIYGLKTT